MRELAEFLVTPSSPLGETIRTINEGAAQIALVVDKDARLVGTVTDGDVRRALLAGLNLDTPASEFMNPSPHTLAAGSDEEEILSLMRREGVHQVPLVDSAGRVVRLFSFDALLRPRRRPNSVVVMAGGKGRRLLPLSAATPKPMVQVGGRPMIEIVLEQCISHGFRDFYLSVSHLKQQIIDHVGEGDKWDVQVRYLEESRPLGTAGALGLLPDNLQAPVLVINADVLTRVDLAGLMQFHTDHSATATMAVREHQTSIPYGVVYADGVHVRGLEEKPSLTHFVSAGIYVLEPSVLERVPAGDYLDMPDLLKTLVADDARVIAYPIHEYWIDAGHPDAVAIAEDEWT